MSEETGAVGFAAGGREMRAGSDLRGRAADTGFDRGERAWTIARSPIASTNWRVKNMNCSNGSRMAPRPKVTASVFGGFRGRSISAGTCSASGERGESSGSTPKKLVLETRRPSRATRVERAAALRTRGAWSRPAVRSRRNGIMISRRARGAFGHPIQAVSCRSRMRPLQREHRVDLSDGGGTFSDGRRDAFGRARADIADGEHAGPAGLERQGGAAGRAGALGKVEAGEDEALGVHRRAAGEP